jgi:hypothetical protein
MKEKNKKLLSIFTIVCIFFLVRTVCVLGEITETVKSEDGKYELILREQRLELHDVIARGSNATGNIEVILTCLPDQLRIERVSDKSEISKIIYKIDQNRSDYNFYTLQINLPITKDSPRTVAVNGDILTWNYTNYQRIVSPIKFNIKADKKIRDNLEEIREFTIDFSVTIYLNDGTNFTASLPITFFISPFYIVASVLSDNFQELGTQYYNLQWSIPEVTNYRTAIRDSGHVVWKIMCDSPLPTDSSSPIYIGNDLTFNLGKEVGYTCSNIDDYYTAFESAKKNGNFNSLSVMGDLQYSDLKSDITAKKVIRQRHGLPTLVNDVKKIGLDTQQARDALKFIKDNKANTNLLLYGPQKNCADMAIDGYHAGNVITHIENKKLKNNIMVSYRVNNKIKTAYIGEPPEEAMQRLIMEAAQRGIQNYAPTKKDMIKNKQLGLTMPRMFRDKLNGEKLRSDD